MGRETKRRLHSSPDSSIPTELPSNENAYALQRTAPAVTLAASTAAFPPTMQPARQPPPSLSLGSILTLDAPIPPVPSGSPILAKDGSPLRISSEKEQHEALWQLSLMNQVWRMIVLIFLAIVFFIARRRTGLIGFRWLLCAATGLLATALLSMLGYGGMADWAGLQAFIIANKMRIGIDWLLYALGLAGIISLLRSARRPAHGTDTLS